MMDIEITQDTMTLLMITILITLKHVNDIEESDKTSRTALPEAHHIHVRLILVQFFFYDISMKGFCCSLFLNNLRSQCQADIVYGSGNLVLNISIAFFFKEKKSPELKTHLTILNPLSQFRYIMRS